MKFVTCFVLFSVVALTFGEECGDVDDCTHVACPESDYILECVRHSCTCTHDTPCLDASDCEDLDENCRFDWHCVDGQCRCGFGFDGELPGGELPGGGAGGPGK